MKKFALIAIVIVIAVAIGGYMFFNSAEGETQAEAPLPSTDLTLAKQPIVSAEGYVLPEHDINIAFKTNGRLVELLVKEGDQIKAGQLLAKLDSVDQQFSVAEAEANLATAKAELAKTTADPTPEDVAQQEVAIAKAEAALETLMRGATDEQIAEAKANLAVKQAELNQTLSGNRTEELLAAESTMMQAAADVQKAQYEYNKVDGNTRDEAIESAGVNLQSATIRYEQSKARYETLQAGSTDEEIAVMRALVGEQQASYNITTADPTAEDITILMAAVEARKADLEQLLVGAKDETIAINEAKVKEAEATLEKVKALLADTEIVAPFDGIVTDLPVELGETIEVGQSILTLASLKPWHIETDDLTEIDVVQVEEGQPVRIMVDALPTESFAGVVTRVKPQSETKAGDVTYTVHIAFADNGAEDTRLRWGMTTFVDIEVE